MQIAARPTVSLTGVGHTGLMIPMSGIWDDIKGTVTDVGKAIGGAVAARIQTQPGIQVRRDAEGNLISVSQQQEGYPIAQVGLDTNVGTSGLSSSVLLIGVGIVAVILLTRGRR